MPKAIVELVSGHVWGRLRPPFFAESQSRCLIVRSDPPFPAGRADHSLRHGSGVLVSDPAPSSSSGKIRRAMTRP